MFRRDQAVPIVVEIVHRVIPRLPDRDAILRYRPTSWPDNFEGMNVVTKINSAQVRNQVYGQWAARSPEQRQHADTEEFIDSLWDSGIRLGRSSSLHYQHVMDVIRAKITD